MNEPSTERRNAARADDERAGAEAALPVIETLRERVVKAVEELARLKSANLALQERVRVLTEGQGGPAPAALFDDDTDVVKERIVRFIEAIDRYMEDVEETGTEGE